MTGSPVPNDQLKHIQNLVRENKRREAAQLLKQFLQENPDSADGYFLAAFLSTDPERKIRLCERALAIDPEHLPARKLLESLRAASDETGIVPYRSSSSELVTVDKFVEVYEPKARPIELVGQVKSPSNNNLIFGLAVGAVVIIAFLAIADVVLSRRAAPATVAVPVVRVVTATPAPIMQQPLPSITPSITDTPRPRRTTTDSRILSQTPYIPRTLPTTIVPTPTEFRPTKVPTTVPSPTIYNSPTATRDPFSAPRLNVAIKPLAYHIVDAEYSASLDRIISVSDSPSALHIYDPETNTESTVPLLRPPTCVSVSPDGLFAAVGQDAMVTYVDLQKAVIVKTFNTTTNAFDIILTATRWIYIMSDHEAAAIRAIPPDSDTEMVIPTKTYPRYAIKRSSDGATFYYMGLEGMAHLFPDPTGDSTEQDPWRYHNEAAHCGNMWFTADGSEAVSECGSIYHTSNNKLIDMQANGALPDVGAVFGAAESASAKKLIALTAPGKSTGLPVPSVRAYTPLLDIFDEPIHNPATHFVLPAFADGEGSTGNFVFTNASGNRFYVLVKDYIPTTHLINLASWHQEFGVVAADVSVNQPTTSGNTFSDSTLAPDQFPTPDIATLETTRTAVPGAKSPIQTLDFPVGDAAYSASLDRIVMTNTLFHDLYIYNPANGVIQNIQLSQEVNSLEVSLDGLHAVVSLNLAVVLVDIKSAKVTKTYPVKTPIYEAVLAANGWIYALPKPTDASNHVILGINETTGEVVTYDSPYVSQGKLLLHPDGKRLFYVQIYPQSTNLYRFNINQDGSLSHPYNWPYDESLNHCGYVWLSQDAGRLLTACGTILRLNVDGKLDMSYAGTLAQNIVPIDPGEYYDALADSLPNKVIVALLDVDHDSGPQPNQRILFFNADTLRLSSVIRLPGFIDSYRVIDAGAKYMFVNAKGNRVYLIMQARVDSSDYSTFGVWSAPIPATK